MSSFLDLCADLCVEAGISTPPATVVSQVGESGRVVRWIARAYKNIQNKNTNWDFLRQDFSFPTIVNVNTYAPAAMTPALTELRDWLPDTFRSYLTSLGTNDEQWMEFIPWPIFRDMSLFAANRNVPGRPYRFTIRPRDKAIVTFPTCSALYTIAGEYFMRAQTMAADTDVPIFPEEFHDTVTWLALTYYGAFEGAAEVYAHGDDEYKKAITNLEVDQLPEITTGGAMA